MSALHPKADMCTALAHVCFGPIADMACLLDHLVGAGEQRWRHRDSERLGSFEIDDKFVLAWGLYGQVGRLLTFEDTIDIARRLSELVLQARAIGYKRPGDDMGAIKMDCWQFVPRRKTDN